MPRRSVALATLAVLLVAAGAAAGDEAATAAAAAAVAAARAAACEAPAGLHLLQSQSAHLLIGQSEGGKGRVSAAAALGNAAVPAGSVADAIPAAEGFVPRSLASAGRGHSVGPQQGRGVEARRLLSLRDELLLVHRQLREILPSLGPALDRVESDLAGAVGLTDVVPSRRTFQRLAVNGVELQLSALDDRGEDNAEGKSKGTPRHGLEIPGIELSDGPAKVSQVDSDVVHIHGPVTVKVQVLSGSSHPKAGSFDWWCIIAAAVCMVLFAGLMSGLTIGLLSFQPMDLEIIERSTADEQEREMARTLKKVVADQHLLLVTLLLCNAAAMEALPVLLDDIVSPMSAVLISVTVVLLFGEIIPQSLCKSFGLKVGATTAPLVQVLLVVCYPIAWPIGKVLDCIFGCEKKGALYRRAEMKSLVTLQREHGVLTENEAMVIEGALAMGSKMCDSCMTDWRKVTQLSIDAVLDEATLDQLLESGKSRIPVLDNAGKIMGLLITKKLMRIRPEDAMPVRKLQLAVILHISEETHLFDALEAFQNSRSQMAAVYSKTVHLGALTHPPSGASPLGIITVVDVIEELIRSKFPDERDVSSVHSVISAVKSPTPPAQALCEAAGNQLFDQRSELHPPAPGLAAVLRRAISVRGPGSVGGPGSEVSSKDLLWGAPGI